MVLLSIEFYILAILCAFFRGIDPIFAKRGLESGGNWIQNTFQTLVVRTGLAWGALIVISNGKNMLEGISLPIILLFVCAGVVAAAMGQLSYYRGIDRMGASICATITNSRPLFAVLLAVVWLGENMTVSGMIGVISIVMGVVFITRSKSGNISGWKRSDIVFPLFAAVAFAAGNVIRKFGFMEDAAITAIQALAINDLAALVVVGVYGVVIGKGRELAAGNRESYRNFGLSGVGVFLAMLTLYEALIRGPVSVADPILGTGPLFTVIIAASVLKKVERITKGFVIGTLLIIAGVVLLSSMP
ncbi:MAG: DMT family transporter [Halobacteriales archaeon]|nr:DMT family transporter [Halobacteriales archaeon]